MQYVFGKTITTAKGTFEAGEPLPEYWTGKETMRQLRETYGQDVLVESRGAARTFAAIAESLARIEAALGIGAKSNGGFDKQPARPRKRAADTGPVA